MVYPPVSTAAAVVEGALTPRETLSMTVETATVGSVGLVVCLMEAVTVGRLAVAAAAG